MTMKLYRELLFTSTYVSGRKARIRRGFRRITASTPERIRTSNLRFRRPMLYPIELRVLERFVKDTELGQSPEGPTLGKSVTRERRGLPIERRGEGGFSSFLSGCRAGGSRPECGRERGEIPSLRETAR
jgi:hypothetical protein